MNVIISNRNRDVFSNLDVDILKNLNGEFTADEIIQSFSNFFFNRMFLDITAVKDYTDIKNIQKISIGLDVSKIILLLDDNTNNNFYKSKLVSMGIYNFGSDLTSIKYLYDHPNIYKDVAHYQSMDDNNSVASITNTSVVSNARIIGFKNVTDNAGSTSLIYMIKNELSSRYNVKCIEINKKDFMFFNDKDMVSVNSSELGNTILKYKDVDIVLVDLNDMDPSSISGDVLYLIEPSTIKLNKLILLKRNIFSTLIGKKVVLNMSLLGKGDVKDFEREANIDVFYNLSYMNDKEDNSNLLLPFLEKLNLVRRVDNGNNSNDNKWFSFLKF